VFWTPDAAEADGRNPSVARIREPYARTTGAQLTTDAVAVITRSATAASLASARFHPGSDAVPAPPSYSN
jgi:hypothetical protein